MSDPERSHEAKNVAFNEDTHPSTSESLLTRRQWITRANRQRTNLDEVEVDERSFKHAHIIRRPHALQHFHQEHRPKERLVRSDSASSGEGEQRATDNFLVQLTRLDLFIDLIWVGIVANISATFSEQAFTDSGVSQGTAFLEYMLLFIPVWRLWDYLREYGSNYYRDDVVQRNFMVWILVLSVLYGINAPYAFTPDDEGNSLTLLICIYLVARGSFLIAYAVQAGFLPFLRRHVLFQVVTTVAISGLWIAAIFVPYPGKLGLLLAANLAEHPLAIFMASPASDPLLTGGWEHSPDVEHYVERIEGFFIIILGEGVFRLIEGSPSGMGLNAASGVVLTALLLYYCIHWLYFNGDQSKVYVHALRRKWWKGFLWKALIIYAALLILAASVLFLVEHPGEKVSTTTSAEVSSETDPVSTEDLPHFTLYALWSASISLSSTIFAMTVAALLNRPLDKPKTLLINSRWIRLAPRLPAVALIICLPLFKSLTAGAWCGASISILYGVFLWEWMAGMERNWQLIEPKEEGD
ncbi:uncharacterized protein LY89DRAFT_683088 [Mollisia scopiformis]|uniref:Low temperature requirement A n=1 Tax=Mollisia scopiformis TaxID=149040 RepID=A0A194XG59_MOLSC|nr:uncharacterized protein LY89DRAFT_683088 [Mollisia scopiformis]KUJ19158.1 hypothetical protein LY89DRAFT_683088 [Mollisia scopiformis]